jgi:probable DNA metabolism protein
MRSVLAYDSTFEGFLSAVFQVYEEKLNDVSIERNELATETFFTEHTTVITDSRKANRVWKELARRCSAGGLHTIYQAFLSELPNIESTLLHFIKRSLSEKNHVDKDFADPEILKIAKVVKMVGREKHRMDAFVRFRLTKENLYFATVSPDFNVLPLNAKHFKNRYADQQWLIYDLKRKYGLHYDLKKVTYVALNVLEKINTTSKASLYFTEDEVAFQELWKNYYTSANIVSRKNVQLHLQHIPQRYWKYLSEKTPTIKK